MKFLIILAFFILSFAEVNLTKEEKTFIQTHQIKCITSGNWPPFSIYENNHLEGIAVEFWKKISDKLNIKSLCYVNPKWHEILQEIKYKHKDLTPITDITKERKKYAIFSIPYAKFQYVIITKNDVMFIPSMKYLKNKTIAISNKYTIMSHLKKDYPNLKIIITDSIEESLQKVKENEAFATITLLPIAAYYLNKYEFKNLSYAK